jgi:integrase/recombinase XerD
MHRTEPTWLTDDERKMLLASGLSPRDRAIITTFLFAGLRSNELRMLDIQDIDFENAQIHVRYGKRGKKRTIPLHKRVADALKQHLDSRTSGPVFLSERQQRISNRGLRHLIKRLGAEAGIEKDLHPTALRHTFAVSLFRNRVDFRTVRKLMGHNTVSMAALYALHGITDPEEAINSLHKSGV